MVLIRQLFENIVAKEENAGNHHFLFFLQCFLTFRRQSYLIATLNLSSANASNLCLSKILLCAESKESTRPLVLTGKKLGQGKWIILLV